MKLNVECNQNRKNASCGGQEKSHTVFSMKRARTCLWENCTCSETFPDKHHLYGTALSTNCTCSGTFLGNYIYNKLHC